MGQAKYTGKNDWLFRPHHAKVWGTKWKKSLPHFASRTLARKRSPKHKTFPISRKKNKKSGKRRKSSNKTWFRSRKRTNENAMLFFFFVAGKCSVILFQRLLLLRSIKEALSTVISLSFFSRSFKLPPYSPPKRTQGYIYEKAPSENHTFNPLFI